MAVMDAVVGFIPVAGTIFDIFIRPSRKALDVHQHIRDEYQIRTDHHVVHFCMKVWNADNSNPLSGVILWWPGSGFICQIF